MGVDVDVTSSGRVSLCVCDITDETRIRLVRKNAVRLYANGGADPNGNVDVRVYHCTQNSRWERTGRFILKLYFLPVKNVKSNCRRFKAFCLRRASNFPCVSLDFARKMLIPSPGVKCTFCFARKMLILSRLVQSSTASVLARDGRRVHQNRGSRFQRSIFVLCQPGISCLNLSCCSEKGVELAAWIVIAFSWALC